MINSTQLSSFNFRVGAEAESSSSLVIFVFLMTSPNPESIQVSSVTILLIRLQKTAGLQEFYELWNWNQGRNIRYFSLYHSMTGCTHKTWTPILTHLPPKAGIQSFMASLCPGLAFAFCSINMLFLSLSSMCLCWVKWAYTNQSSLQRWFWEWVIEHHRILHSLTLVISFPVMLWWPYCVINHLIR